jgi:hypothetical protein
MKLESQPVATSFAALILKVAGLLLISVVLVDYLVLAIPPNFLNSAWLSNLISEWVGRGTIPLIGVALILFGVWVEQFGTNRIRSQKWLSGALIAASILGALFLLLTPIYFRNNQLASAVETRQVNEEAALAERQLNAQLAQQREQLATVIGNPALLAQVQQQLQASAAEGEEEFLRQARETLAEVQADPAALDQKVEEARQEGLEVIQAQQREQVAQLTTNLRKSRVRITLNSLFLAIGYLIIAGNGLGIGKQKRATMKRSKRRAHQR